MLLNVSVCDTVLLTAVLLAAYVSVRNSVEIHLSSTPTIFWMRVLQPRRWFSTNTKLSRHD